MTTVIRAKWVWDGTSRAPIDDGTLVIERDTISAIGKSGQVVAPPDAPVIDLPDQFVLPGLIDAHTHVSIIPGLGNQTGQMMQPLAQQLLRAVNNVRQDFASGVTTMRVMGEEYFLDLDLRAAIQAGQIVGPRLICSARGITAFNGHGRALSFADGVADIRRFARENLKAGADWLKIFATGGVSSTHTSLDYVVYSRDELAAAAEEAHRVGKGIAAHAHGGAGLRLCLDVGIDTIEHGALATRDDLEAIEKHKAWLIGTLSILFHPTGIEQGDGAVPAIREKMLHAREIVAQNFSQVPRSNVQYAMGTDSMHGHLPTEAELLVRFGATPQDALRAITSRAAQAIRVNDRVGTLAPGKLADVISVRGNPLEDISALRQIGLLMKNGVRYDPLSAN